MEQTNKELRYALLQATRYDVEHAKKCYDFIQAEEPASTPTTAGRPDGLYFVFAGGSYQPSGTDLTDEQKNQVTGIGYQSGRISFRVALHDHKDVVLLPENKKAEKRTGYLKMECDALHDFADEDNTRRLLADNPELKKILGEGEFIPACGTLNEICYIREMLNEALTYAGGDPLDLDAWYWSSTEYGQGHSWTVSFSNGYAGNGNKSGAIAVRAVAAF